MAMYTYLDGMQTVMDLSYQPAPNSSATLPPEMKKHELGLCHQLPEGTVEPNQSKRQCFPSREGRMGPKYRGHQHQDGSNTSTMKTNKQKRWGKILWYIFSPLGLHFWVQKSSAYSELTKKYKAATMALSRGKGNKGTGSSSIPLLSLHKQYSGSLKAMSKREYTIEAGKQSYLHRWRELSEISHVPPPSSNLITIKTIGNLSRKTEQQWIKRSQNKGRPSSDKASVCGTATWQQICCWQQK